MPAQPKRKLVTKLVCDRMWGRKTCNWFTTAFPSMKGKTLEFHSDRAVEFAGRVGMLEWLMDNRYI